MIDLESQLTTAMREQVGDLRPSRDLLAAARRANSRRGVAVKATSAVGVLGLGGAVALSLPGLTAAGPTPAPPGPAPVSSSAPVELTIALVSQRIKAVLADETGKVQFLDLRVHGGGLEPNRSQIWYDGATGAQRSRVSGPDGTVITDFSIAPDGPDLVSRLVDHESRTWRTDTVRARLEQPPGSLLMGTPAQIKAELDDGTWTLAGREGDTLHLSQRFDDGAAGFELWVDATTFEVTRMASSKPAKEGVARQEGAVRWLPRTEAVLDDLEAEVPPGYRKVDRPMDEPATGPGQG
jgi:hypothetical protein